MVQSEYNDVEAVGLILTRPRPLQAVIHQPCGGQEGATLWTTSVTFHVNRVQQYTNVFKEKPVGTRVVLFPRSKDYYFSLSVPWGGITVENLEGVESVPKHRMQGFLHVSVNPKDPPTLLVTIHSSKRETVVLSDNLLRVSPAPRGQSTPLGLCCNNCNTQAAGDGTRPSHLICSHFLSLRMLCYKRAKSSELFFVFFMVAESWKNVRNN